MAGVSIGDRIPVLVFDDGTPRGAAALDRALDVASHVVLVNAHRTPNHTRNVAAADDADVPVEVVNLPANQGIRHALAECVDRDVYLAIVPAVDDHTGSYLRRIIQAAAASEVRGHPVLAVQMVRDGPAPTGPVVEIDPAETDSGFAFLFAAGLAATTGSPLHILHLAGDRSHVDVRHADALHRARRLIADDHIPTYEQNTDDDPVDSALDHARGASAVVVGLGGVTITGRKATAPDELPDSVLETPDGRLLHALARHAESDVVVVLDTIEIHQGHLAKAAAVAAAVAAIGVGTVAAGAAGLAITSGVVATAAVSVAALGD